MLEHGGALVEAAEKFKVPIGDWLDLSTGVNPASWPTPTVPQHLWHKLPQNDKHLEAKAADYYKNDCLLVTAGSQASIQALPFLRNHSKVGVLSPSYSEHRHAWAKAGHQIVELDQRTANSQCSELDVLVIVNPDNPSGLLWKTVDLLALCENLSSRGGWLIVDEAFIDTTPELSIVDQVGKPGLVVLRSLGKFFGLAGARVGFAFAWAELLLRLKETLGPWPVSGPARWLAAEALSDRQWQEQTRTSLIDKSKRLGLLLSHFGMKPSGSTSLFQWILCENARDFHDFLARQGILTRLFLSPKSIRFGLPGNEKEWHRLTEALELYSHTSLKDQLQSDLQKTY